ncbi:MAG TPA: SAF domain-containing protein [Arachnia sp.]|nr:SAF domain-containing protein [Arachnia sp.]HMT85241.1 SAF domain-containing protein [Arachnia sp.]
MKRKRSASDDSPDQARRPAAVQLRARRSPRLIALGVLVVALGALGAAALHTMNNDRVPVLAMAVDVGRGETISAESITTVEIPATLAEGALTPDEADQLVGQRARSDLLQGSYPRPDHVGDAALPDGEVLIGLRLPLGRMPVTTMPPGTQVQLVSLVDNAQASAVVTSLPAAVGDGETFVLDVRVRADQATTLTRLAATDQVALIMTKEA